MQPRSRKSIQLSHIKRIAYDITKKVLEIEFQRGGTHLYHGVPEETFQAFETSDSKWGYFLGHIRKGYRSTPKR